MCELTPEGRESLGQELAGVLSTYLQVQEEEELDVDEFKRLLEEELRKKGLLS